MRKYLTQINSLDIELYEYAKVLYNQRFTVLQSLTEKFLSTPWPLYKMTELKQLHAVNAKQCLKQSICPASNISVSMMNSTGHFRPPGHKSPVNSTWLESKRKRDKRVHI